MSRRQWVIGCSLLLLGVVACLATRWLWWSSDFDRRVLLLYFVPLALYVIGATVITWGSGRFREIEAPLRDPNHELRIDRPDQKPPPRAGGGGR
jgi:hypothetical protein